jgi:hypothetical protein
MQNLEDLLQAYRGSICRAEITDLSSRATLVNPQQYFNSHVGGYHKKNKLVLIEYRTIFPGSVEAKIPAILALFEQLFQTIESYNLCLTSQPGQQVNALVLSGFSNLLLLAVLGKLLRGSAAMGSLLSQLRAFCIVDDGGGGYAPWNKVPDYNEQCVRYMDTLLIKASNLTNLIINPLSLWTEKDSTREALLSTILKHPSLTTLAMQLDYSITRFFPRLHAMIKKRDGKLTIFAEGEQVAELAGVATLKRSVSQNSLLSYADPTYEPGESVPAPC